MDTRRYHEPGRYRAGNGPDVLGTQRIPSTHAARTADGVAATLRSTGRFRSRHSGFRPQGQGLRPLRRHRHHVRRAVRPGAAGLASAVAQPRHPGLGAGALRGGDGRDHAPDRRRSLCHQPLPASHTGQWRLSRHGAGLCHRAAPRTNRRRCLGCRHVRRGRLDPPLRADYQRRRHGRRLRARYPAVRNRRRDGDERLTAGTATRRADAAADASTTATGANTHAASRHGGGTGHPASGNPGAGGSDPGTGSRGSHHGAGRSSYPGAGRNGCADGCVTGRCPDDEHPNGDGRRGRRCANPSASAADVASNGRRSHDTAPTDGRGDRRAANSGATHRRATDARATNSGAADCRPPPPPSRRHLPRHHRRRLKSARSPPRKRRGSSSATRTAR